METMNNIFVVFVGKKNGELRWRNPSNVVSVYIFCKGNLSHVGEVQL